ncbi:UvrB/UvrC motif-containing protein [Algisphaera agarilytica]|uniref:Protein arginine kinase activator n=1 Tax=Algisphaera agarilytica TaxID=1385975 RepID=A0A7X0LKW6_9BACT|nr:UvrB/UvrC motif-containing protein [Algisphaera agarilytica]MBB6430875.1 protein arginine kinase activator [Algisphaera agarilytica]
MKNKCDKCNRPATHHSVEISKEGEKVAINLCDACAAEEGLTMKSAHAPINELLTNFVKLHSGGASGEGESGKSGEGGSPKDTACENCGTTFADFRENSLLGCPMCYKTFEQPLSPLLERAHEGGTHHIGKVPRRAGVGEQRQMAMQRLRRQLDDAVMAEDYELAARLRDDIQQMEGER